MRASLLVRQSQLNTSFGPPFWSKIMSPRVTLWNEILFSIHLLKLSRSFWDDRSVTWSEFSPSRIVWTVLNRNPRELPIWAKPNPTGELSDRNAGFREHAIRAGGTIWLDSRWLQQRWLLVRWCVGSLHHDVMKVKQRKPPKVSMFFFIFCYHLLVVHKSPPFSFREIPRSTNKILEKLMERSLQNLWFELFQGSVLFVLKHKTRTAMTIVTSLTREASIWTISIKIKHVCHIMFFDLRISEHFRAFQGISAYFSYFAKNIQFFMQRFSHPTKITVLIILVPGRYVF